MVGVGRDPFLLTALLIGLLIGLTNAGFDRIDTADAGQLLDQPGWRGGAEFYYRQQAVVVACRRIDAFRHDEVAVALLLADAVGAGGVAWMFEQHYGGIGAQYAFDRALPAGGGHLYDVPQHRMFDSGVAPCAA